MPPALGTSITNSPFLMLLGRNVKRIFMTSFPLHALEMPKLRNGKDLRLVRSDRVAEVDVDERVSDINRAKQGIAPLLPKMSVRSTPPSKSSPWS